MAKATQGERARAHTPNTTPDEDAAPGPAEPLSLSALHRRLRMGACFAPTPPEAAAHWHATLSRALVGHLDNLDACADAMEDQANALDYLASVLLPSLNLSEFEQSALRGLLMPLSLRAKTTTEALRAALDTQE